MPFLKSPSNRLLAALPLAERADLFRRTVPVEPQPGTVLIDSGEPFRHVYFPCTSFFSVLATSGGPMSLEVGLIGSEGMVGVSLALGVAASPMRTVVRGGGTALRMSAGDFNTVLNVSPGLRRVLHRYAHVFMEQLAQVAICTRFHLLESRLAAWMLATHDRAGSDTFHYTHEMLAESLGVRRASVSTAAAALQSRGLIGYARGAITVLDRKGLEQTACDCYRTTREIYSRIFA